MRIHTGLVLFHPMLARELSRGHVFIMLVTILALQEKTAVFVTNSTNYHILLIIEYSPALTDHSQAFLALIRAPHTLLLLKPTLQKSLGP